MEAVLAEDREAVTKGEGDEERETLCKRLGGKAMEEVLLQGWQPWRRQVVMQQRLREE